MSPPPASESNPELGAAFYPSGGTISICERRGFPRTTIPTCLPQPFPSSGGGTSEQLRQEEKVQKTWVSCLCPFPLEKEKEGPGPALSSIIVRIKPTSPYSSTADRITAQSQSWAQSPVASLQAKVCCPHAGATHCNYTTALNIRRTHYTSASKHQARWPGTKKNQKQWNLWKPWDEYKVCYFLMHQRESGAKLFFFPPSGQCFITFFAPFP